MTQIRPQTKRTLLN